MAATEVTGFALRPFSALSGADRARVALARVLAQRAPLLPLDEPTAVVEVLPHPRTGAVLVVPRREP
ncbi:hypothetical protein GCM10010254_14010 [Streptomyces chromofuscus]|nr:hypothetical protein GCM10010254_14010 [Streptomyces chromofuscus]